MDQDDFRGWLVWGVVLWVAAIAHRVWISEQSVDFTLSLLIECFVRGVIFCLLSATVFGALATAFTRAVGAFPPERFGISEEDMFWRQIGKGVIAIMTTVYMIVTLAVDYAFADWLAGFISAPI